MRSLQNLALAVLLAGVLGFSSCGNFFVSEGTINTVTISPASVILKTGTDTATNTITLDATAITVGGTTSDVTSTATWTTGNSSIVTVAAGVVTAGTTTGVAVITAKDGSVSGTANVIATNTALPTSLTVSGATSVVLNSRTQFTATVPVNIVNGSADITQFVSWSSSNTAVATVNSFGIVSALATCGTLGTACPTITASIATASTTLTQQVTLVSIQ